MTVARANGAAALMRSSIASANEQLNPRQATSEHTTAPINHTRPSPRKNSPDGATTADIRLQLTTQFIDPERMKGWDGLGGWHAADELPIYQVTRQMQVERRTGKVLRPRSQKPTFYHCITPPTNWCWLGHIFVCCFSQGPKNILEKRLADLMSFCSKFIEIYNGPIINSINKGLAKLFRKLNDAVILPHSITMTWLKFVCVSTSCTISFEYKELRLRLVIFCVIKYNFC